MTYMYMYVHVCQICTFLYIVVHSFTHFYILIFIVELVDGEKLVHGSSVSFSILRKKKKIRNLSHFLVMLERFWEHSHQQRN
jgi:hypothetical protein